MKLFEMNILQNVILVQSIFFLNFMYHLYLNHSTDLNSYSDFKETSSSKIEQIMEK